MMLGVVSTLLLVHGHAPPVIANRREVIIRDSSLLSKNGTLHLQANVKEILLITLVLSFEGRCSPLARQVK